MQGLDEIRAELWAQARSGGTGLLRLLPRHKIAATAHVEGGERFVDLFRRTWARIPLGFRRTMLRHWRESDLGLKQGILMSPLIELASGWSGRERGTIGFCGGGGHKILFWAKRFNAMPDALAQDLIAHELAHVWQWTQAPEDFAADDGYDLETWADELMELWGFDATAMDDWSAAQGFVKVWTDEEVAKLSPSQRKRLRARAKRAGRGVGLHL